MLWGQSQYLHQDGKGAVKGAGKAGKDAGNHAAGGCPAGRGNDADDNAGKEGTAGKYEGKGLSPGPPRPRAGTKAGVDAGNHDA